MGTDVEVKDSLVISTQDSHNAGSKLCLVEIEFTFETLAFMKPSVDRTP